MHRAPAQLDLFHPTATNAAGGGTSNQPPQNDEEPLQQLLLEARLSLLRDVQLRLIRLGLWGFPNVIRNPDGPWKEYRASILDLQARRACWPATYILRAGTDGIHRFAIRVRPGCDGNPAVPRAADVMAGLAPVSLAQWDGVIGEYEAD